MKANLYQGCDAIVRIVENNRNSIGVLNQIQQVADRLETPFYDIWNRAKSTQIPESLLQFSDRLLGQVRLDNAIEDFDYAALNDQTKLNVNLIWKTLLEKASKPNLQHIWNGSFYQRIDAMPLAPVSTRLESPV